MDFVIGALAAALLISLTALVAQHFSCRRAVDQARKFETVLLDRAHAAELRSARQIDAMLDRLSTEPRLQMRPAEAHPAPELGARKYIADHPADDEAWNDYRGEPAEENE